MRSIMNWSVQVWRIYRQITLATLVMKLVVGSAESKKYAEHHTSRNLEKVVGASPSIAFTAML